MITVETLNAWAALWTYFMWGSLIDATVVLVLVSVVWAAFKRRMSTQFGYCLFLLVLVKLVIPLPLSVPGWPGYLSPRHAISRALGWTAAPGDATSAADALHGAPSRSNEASLSQAAPHGTPVQVSLAKPAETAMLPALSLRAVLMLSYGLVVVTLLAGMAWVQRRCRRMLHRATLLDPARLPLRFSDLRVSSGVRNPVSLRTSPNVSSPAIAGLIRPCLMLPTGFSETLTHAQMRFVLAHELAHVRRWDLWVSAAQRLVQIVYFFNPAVWMANWRVDHLREYACDDAALLVCGSPRRECGEAFLRVAERTGARSASMASALGLINRNSFTRRRLMRIIDRDRRVRTGLSTGALVSLAVVAAIALPSIRASESKSGQPLHINEPASAPTASSSQAPDPEPRESDRDEADEFERLYRLGPDEILKTVLPPYPAGRLTYYRSLRSDDSHPNGPAIWVFRWRDHKRERWGESHSANKSGGSVYSLIGLLTGIPHQEIVDDEALPEIRLKGDFIVRETAPADAVVSRLQQILREQYQLPVKLTFRNVKRSVLVARGEYKFTAIPGRPGERIEIYGDELQDPSKNFGMGGGQGTFDRFLQGVGSWLDVPVVSEVKSPPQHKVHWSYSMPYPFTEQQLKKAKDPKLVLANLKKQTGLTFTEEVREIPILFVEPQDEDGAKQEGEGFEG